MATTQYIGARYVPLFADPAEWNSTRTYEALTIVMNEGNSYTAKQYVPKGIDISNEDFWALTGNYNAQVEAYRKEVAAYDGRITENANAIATLNSEMSGVVDSGLRTLISSEADRAKAAENNITSETAHYTLKAEYDYNSMSHYKFFTFPKKYYPLSKLNISIALSSYIEDCNYGKWLQSKTEGVYVNGPMNGPVVVGGRALIEKATGTAEGWYVLKETNGVFTSVKDISHEITASQLVSQNVDLAFCVWHPLVENNIKFNTSNLPDTESNYNYIITKKQPRTIFGFDDDNWYIVLIEGRGYINAGATFDESYNLVASLGIKNAYQMDGGHSVQLWNVNPIFNFAYQNSSTKGYGFASGSMFSFLEFHK